MHDAGFGLIIDPSDLSKKEQKLYRKALSKGDFLISPGRYYIDGLLCENDQLLLYSDQEYLLPREGEGTAHLMPGIYQVYLDVWKRHISYLEDPDIREVALGGPDTTTRTKVEWRVMAESIKKPVEGSVDLPPNCKALQGAWPATSGGEMTVHLRDDSGEDEACRMAERGKYQGVENHLYRIEVHHGGDPLGWRGADPISAKKLTYEEEKGERISLGTNPAGAADPWQKGRLIELFLDEEPRATARIISRTFENDELILTLDRVIPTGLGDEFFAQPLASFKWSRENGSVAFGVEEILEDLVDRSIKTRARVSRLGRENGLTLRRGDFVEVSGDWEEVMRGEVGTLAQVKDVKEGDLMVTLDRDITCHKGDRHLKIRRWDQAEECVAVSLEKTAIEHGLAVKFGGHGFLTGDYWTFYARVGGAVEALDKARPPAGVFHHYCNLGVIQIALPPSDTEEQLIPGVLQDCRHLFPPASELVALHYVGGDGQEAMPGEFLAEPLRVRVLNGGVPVEGRSVRFTIESGDGSLDAGLLPSGSGMLAAGTEQIAITRDDGIAECRWSLTEDVSGTSPPRPLVRAALLDHGDDPIPGQEIWFAASLSMASEVYYNSTSCPQMGLTVQAAIDRLAGEMWLQALGDECLEARPGDDPRIIRVLVANSCGTVEGAAVRFSVELGEGAVDPPEEVVLTNDEGIAECRWALDEETPVQMLKATLLEGRYPIIHPASLAFTANLSLAGRVAYSPPGDCWLKGVDDVQEALDEICRRACTIPVRPGDRLDLIIRELQELGRSDLHFCLLPGDHELNGLEIKGEGKLRLKIEGCSQGTRLMLRDNPWIVEGLASLRLADLDIRATEMGLTKCDDVEISSCRISSSGQGKSVMQDEVGIRKTAFAFRSWGYYDQITSPLAVKGGLAAYLFDEGSLQDDQVIFNKSEMKDLRERGLWAPVLRDMSCLIDVSKDFPLLLEEGYELALSEANGEEVHLTLNKDGHLVDERSMRIPWEGAKVNETTCIYASDEMVTLAVHFKRIYDSAYPGIITADGIWQISCEPRLFEETPSKVALMNIEDARRVCLVGNSIEAVPPLDLYANQLLLGIIDEKLADQLTADRQIFVNSIKKAVDRLAEETKYKDRVRMAIQLSEAMKGEQLTDSMLKMYEIIVKGLGQATMDSESVYKSIYELYIIITNMRGLLASSTAIMMGDARGRSIFRDNEIWGTVSLYGPASNAVFTARERDRAGAMARFFAPINQGGSLQMVGNMLVRMDLGREMVKEIKERLFDQEESTPWKVEVLGTMIVSNNQFQEGRSLWLANDLNLSGNSFERSIRNEIGIAAAKGSVYLGNNGDADSALFDASKSAKDSANLITIVLPVR